MSNSGKGERRLGRYHLGEPVGGGPTGEVLRARVHGVAGFERQFALKRFHSLLVASDGPRNVLRNAARLYAGLEHPRIARLHEHNFETPTPYVAVEWVPGLDLARLIDATFGQGKPLPAGASTSILSRAARAVGYAHGRGHAHLGLSPTNLLCTPAGEIKVTDFGFLPARLSVAPADDTTLFARIGYLAPEQLRNEATSPATDVFCLGTLFFELLTGQRAFTGRTGRDIAGVITGSAPATDQIPKPIARVLDRCFAQSPLERYPSGGALADAIDAASRGMLMRGDQRDAARAVQESMARLEELRQKQVSGVLSFPIPAPPKAPLGAPGSSAAIANQRSLGVPNLELDERVIDDAITDVLPQDLMPPEPISQTRPAAAPVPSIPPPLSVKALDPSSSASISGPAIAAQAFSSPLGDGTQTTPFARPDDEEDVTSPSLESTKTPRQIPLAPPPASPVDAAERPPSNFGAGLLDAGEPSSLGRKALFGLLFVALCASGFFAALLIFGGDDGGDDDKTKTAAVTRDSGALVDRDGAASVPTTLDADAGASALRDAGVDAAIDAASADAGRAELFVTSDPRRATVYLDGTKIGRTPVKVDTAQDRHKLVVIRPGHKIHIADINGGGELKVTLDEVTPSGGPAGIKVRCKKKNRYYVWVDGKESGQLCPTERIEVELGEHVVEIYDPVTDSRRRFDVNVEQTRRSHRVRVDY